MSTLPPGLDIRNTAAEIIVHPNGRWLYASNRGHDSIVRFAIGSDHRLSGPRWFPSLGNVPRNMAVDPTGQFLLVANQASDSLQIFSLGEADGDPVPCGSIALGTPMGICFIGSG